MVLEFEQSFGKGTQIGEVVRREDISMCGYGPTVALLTAAKELGVRKAELVKYATSGDVSGDRKLVVGYAGIALS